MKNSVLLLSYEPDIRSYLSIIRSFGRNDFDVHTAITRPGSSCALKSKYLHITYEVPSYIDTPNEWLEAVKSICTENNFELVIPCDDISILALNKYKTELSALSKLYIIDEKTHFITNNKHETVQLAKSLGISIPESYLCNSLDDIQSVKDKFSFPAVLKPVSSFTEKSTVRNQVVIIQDESELNNRANEILEIQAVQIQSYFQGVGISLCILANRGEILFTTQHQRLHEPFEGGGGTYRKSTDIHPGFIHAAQLLISDLNYTGVAMFEFRHNMETDEWVLIEINSRFWGSLPLAISSGIDFPYLLYCVLRGNNLDKNKIRYKPNTYQRNLTHDLFWLSEAFSIKPDTKLLNYGYTRYSLIKETFRLFLFQDKVDSFTIDDPKPFISELGKITKILFSKVYSKIMFPVKNNSLVRKIQRKKIIKKLKKANNIVFICKGNICRSPFTSQVANTLWQNKSAVSSFGYYGREDRSVPPRALSIAKDKFSVDLSRHQSSIISEDDIKNADIVFYFDNENYSALKTKFYKYKNKMYPISSLSLNCSYEIQDPIDFNNEMFTQTYHDLYTLINDVSTCLK